MHPAFRPQKRLVKEAWFPEHYTEAHPFPILPPDYPAYSVTEDDQRGRGLKLPEVRKNKMQRTFQRGQMGQAKHQREKHQQTNNSTQTATHTNTSTTPTHATH